MSSLESLEYIRQNFSESMAMADSDNNDEEAALGPSSCALGPYPVAVLSGKHLCRKSFRSATIYCASSTTKTGEKNSELSSMPSIVVVGGWGCGETVLAAWGPFLASHGIVAMTIGTPRPFEDTPADRSMALLEASKALQSENDRAGSVLRGRLDVTRRAAMGFALGGSAARIAASEDPTLRCIVALCPHDGTGTGTGPKTRRPDATATTTATFPEQQLSHHTPSSVPVLVVAGEEDDMAPPSQHAWPMYHGSGATAPKLIVEIADGDHGIALGPAGWNPSEEGKIRSCVRTCRLVCSLVCFNCCGVAIPFEGSMEGHARERSPWGAIGGVTLAWLRLFLLGDEKARSELVRRPGIASGFESSGVANNDAAVETTRAVLMERE